jgi:hypothetical protein
MNSTVTISRYGRRNWAVFLNGELLAVTLYLKGASAVQAAITRLSTHHGKEVHHATQAA